MADQTFHVYPDPDGSGHFVAKSDDGDLVVRGPNRSAVQRGVLNLAEEGVHRLTAEVGILFQHHDSPQAELHSVTPAYVNDGRAGDAAVAQAAPAVVAAEAPPETTAVA